MGVSVSNIAALKNIQADGHKLRWVESEKSWYWSDPDGVDTADEINVVTPILGTGLWYKQLARELTPSNWQWDVVTTAPSTLQASKNKAYFCNASTDNPITITLPVTATLGDTIRIKKLDNSTWNRRIIVDRNGHKIENNSTNVFISLKNTDAVLTYIDTTIGWTISSNLPISPITTVTSLNYVSGGDTNGLFYWIGTNKNSVSWTNPAGTTPYQKVFTYSNTSSVDNTITAITSLVNRADDSSALYGAYGACLLYLSVDMYRPFRLAKLTIKTTNSASWINKNIKGFNIYGGTGFGTISTPTSACEYNRINWVLLKSFLNDNTMPNTINTWTVYDIDSPSFYDTYKIVLTQAVGDATFTTYFNEFEMYGDAAW